MTYYDAWNPDINKPRWHHCRTCNGMGHDPYRYDCPDCDASGIRFASICWLAARWQWLRYTVHGLRFWIWDNGYWSICRECHRPNRILRRSIGKHERCLPF